MSYGGQQQGKIAAQPCAGRLDCHCREGTAKVRFVDREVAQETAASLGAQPCEGKLIGAGDNDDGLRNESGEGKREADGGMNSLDSLQARWQILADGHIQARHLCHGRNCSTGH